MSFSCIKLFRDIFLKQKNVFNILFGNLGHYFYRVKMAVSCAMAHIESIAWQQLGVQMLNLAKLKCHYLLSEPGNSRKR